MLKAQLRYDSIELACLIGWVILLLPALMYLLVSWRMRRKVLLNHFPDKAIVLYYEQFTPFSPNRLFRKPKSDEHIQVRFKRDFDSRYGRRHYILPLLLLGIVAGAGMWVTARSVQSWLGLITDFKPFSAITISAFLGGYAWVLNDHFARFRTGDFTHHDVYGGIYRLLIAIPLGLSLATFSNVQAAAGVAFLLAAFPTTTLFKIARRLASKNLGTGEIDESGRLELENLQCIGRANAERYLEEGVSTIAELAWADPIELTIRTNREFNYVVDSISQALLWVYFQDDVKYLYPLSLRGAQEVYTFLNDLKSENADVRGAAEKSLSTGASRVRLKEESFRFTLLTVAEDPYTKFLVAVWAT